MIWPIIKPASVIATSNTGKDMMYTLTAEQMKEAVAEQFDCFTDEEY